MTLLKPTLTIAALMLVSSAFAAPRRTASGISVSASLDSTVMTMGSRTHMRVTVDMPASAAAGARMIDFPELIAGQDFLEWNGVDIVAADSASAITGQNRRIDYDYTIQAFDPGTLTLPPFAVVGSNGADTAFSQALTLKVLPVDVDSLETVNPLYSVVTPQTKWYDYIPDWLIWTLVALAAAALIVTLLIMRRKHTIVEELRRNPPVPPYDLAVSRLTELQQEGLGRDGHEKEFYTRLVDILRQYLQGRFGIYAMEMTSTQILKALRANPDTRMTADQMRAVLSMADFVKFAKVRPLPDDNIRAFNNALDFVEQTKPVPPAEEATGENAENNNPQQ